MIRNIESCFGTPLCTLVGIEWIFYCIVFYGLYCRCTTGILLLN